MGFDLQRAALAAPVKGPQKAVLLAYAIRAGEKGEAFISGARLAIDAGLSPRTASAARRALEAIGALVQVRRLPGGGVVVYRVVPSAIPGSAGAAVPQELRIRESCGTAGAAEGVRGSCGSGSAGAADRTALEQPTEQPIDPPPTPQEDLIEDSATGDTSLLAGGDEGASLTVQPDPVAEPPPRKRRRKKADPIQPVVDAWEEERLKKLEAGKRRKMSKPIPATDALWDDLRKCLKGNQRRGITPLSVDEAVWLVRWAFNSKDNHARNALRREDRSGPLHEYLDPVTLFRITKQTDKLRKMRAWREDQETKRPRRSSRYRREPPPELTQADRERLAAEAEAIDWSHNPMLEAAR